MIITFLFVFATLVNGIPSALLRGNPPPPTRTIAAYPKGQTYFAGNVYVGNYTFFVNHTVTRSLLPPLGRVEFILGQLYVEVDWPSWFPVTDKIQFAHRYQVVGWLWWEHTFTQEGEIWVDKTFLLSHIMPKFENTSFWIASCECGRAIHVYATFDETKYNNLDEAWDAGELIIGIGAGWEATFVQQNTLNLLLSLLFFQDPAIFSTNLAVGVMLNGIIAIPIWAMLAYLIYRLITFVLHL